MLENLIIEYLVLDLVIECLMLNLLIKYLFLNIESYFKRWLFRMSLKFQPARFVVVEVCRDQYLADLHRCLHWIQDRARYTL